MSVTSYLKIILVNFTYRRRRWKCRRYFARTKNEISSFACITFFAVLYTCFNPSQRFNRETTARRKTWEVKQFLIWVSSVWSLLFTNLWYIVVRKQVKHFLNIEHVFKELLFTCTHKLIFCLPRNPAQKIQQTVFHESHSGGLTGNYCYLRSLLRITRANRPFSVAFILCVKTSLCAKPFIWK